jgi:hypothetical protein
MSDIVRVLRIVEYVGERSAVEQQVARSIHGTRVPGAVAISVTTLGEFPVGLDPDLYEAALLAELSRTRDRAEELEEQLDDLRSKSAGVEE